MSKRKHEEHNASWLLDTARDYMVNGNPYAAKSWLLTAKSLYPKDFAVQYEEFFMERKSGKVQKCAKLFYEMITQFSNEQVLWDELSRIFHAQDVTRTPNAETNFLKSMFDSLPQNHQKELLLKYANHQSDLVDKCRISLLVLKRFKGAISDQAVRLITTLKDREEKECPNTPLNIYRKMIVCDILPLILKSPDTEIVQLVPKYRSDTLFVTENQLIYYLNLTMEFFIAYAIDKCSLTTKTNDNMNKAFDIGTFEFDEGGSSWHILHENFILFANQLNWTNFNKFKDKIDPAKNRPLKSRWKTLNNARDSKPSLGLFYPLLQLHIYAVMEYCSSINTTSGKNASSPRGDPAENEFVLVENIGQSSTKENTHLGVIRTPKRKKRNDESGNQSSDYQSSSEDVKVIVHPGLLGQVSEGLGESLQVAIDTENLLRSTFYSEFSQLESEWKMKGWSWMKSYHVDALLYQGRYRAAIDRLTGEEKIHQIRQEKETSQDVDVKNQLSTKRSLQLSSALFSSGQIKAACEKLLQTVSTLQKSSLIFNASNMLEKKSSKHEGRSLILLSCNSNDVLTFTVQVLLAALKEQGTSQDVDVKNQTRLYCEELQRDAVIGHLIVLSQLMWTKNEEFFLHLLKLIEAQDNSRFKYDAFFTYVTEIDILEEIAFLRSQDSITLELMPSEDTPASAKKTVTRGVNREVHGDFRTALERQVERSCEPIIHIIYDFLTNEKRAILDSLTST